MDLHDYLVRIIEDIAVARVDAHTRHDLLADVLAPLGDVEASHEADAIEAHAWRVRSTPHVNGGDVLLHAEADVAAYRAMLALGRAT